MFHVKQILRDKESVQRETDISWGNHFIWNILEEDIVSCETINKVEI